MKGTRLIDQEDRETLQMVRNCFALTVLTMCVTQPLPADDAAADAFNRDVLPILNEHCFECHSHNAKKTQGGLVLDSRSGWEIGGDSGPAIVPGKPDDSLLISAIRYESLEMPPSGRLPDELIERLERWVADGAKDPRVTTTGNPGGGIDLDAGRQHWAFQPVRSVAAPATNNSKWPLNDVDRFVLATLEESGLKPVDDADRYTWLRRVSFDLTGLPPTVDDIRAFIADESPRAKETVVDRLLSSRAFGERWARHWLDLVGYADQIGTSNNVFAQHAWKYRDYVIDAFNNDMPFDRFLSEQIAGDLLDYESVEDRAAAIVATGFLVLGDIEIVESDKARLLVDIVDQQVNKVSKAMLGLTIDCARCHDHKFDPIPQTDYYAMAGFFHGTSTVFKTDRGVWSDVNVVDLPETDAQGAERSQREKAHAEHIAAMQRERQQLVDRTIELDKQLNGGTLAQEERDTLSKERGEAAGQIGQLDAQIQHAEFFAPTVPKAHGVYDVETPGDMRLTIRGNPRALGDAVPRGFLKVISEERPNIPDGTSGRRALAEWISRPDNPLTARVAVNRVWQKLFGEGIVRTVDYFGRPGETPSHPELLDHLATQFVENGWSQKQLIRELVLSHTYSLDSAHNEQGYAVDPGNRLMWRMNRFRLDAEALRDAMLLVSGRLVSSNGGAAMPLEFVENVGGLNPADVNPPHFRLNKWRPHQEFQRTIYLPILRSTAQPGPAGLRNVFDFPQPSQFSGRRSITAVPTQALFLMNSDEVKQQAFALASCIQEQSEATTDRLSLLWLTLLNRPITEAEQHDATTFLESAGDNAWTELCRALLASNEFLMRL